VLDGGPDPPREGEILRGKGRSIVKYRNSLPRAMRKRLNRSRCRSFGMCIRVAPRKHVLHGGAHWHLLANTFNRPRAAAMRPYVKLV